MTSISPARTAAFDILLQVQQQDAYAVELLHSPRYENLSPADHGLATELAMGVIRWRSLLDQRIALHSSQSLNKLDTEVLISLRLAAYQLLFLDRVPGHAAVHESVELVKRARKRSAAPFANAVLRKLAAPSGGQPSRYDAAAPIAAARTNQEVADSSAHPLWLVERWVSRFGYETTRQICSYDQRSPVTTIRFRDAAASGIVEEELKQDRVELSPGRMLASARTVRSGNIAGSLAFRDCRVSIQDEASQLVALLVGHGSRILDCCAAPGGKTRVLAERNPDAEIVAMDIHPHRARLLRTLVPHKTVDVLAADIRDFPAASSFDHVLADVPCSGTGTLSRNPEIKWKLKPEDLLELQGRQLEIVQSAMTHVGSGGRLIYSTCSLEREENENVVEKAAVLNPSFRIIECGTELRRLQSEGELVWSDPATLVSGLYLRTIPGIHPCDGFFAAILEKH